MSEKLAYTVKEAASATGVSPATIWRALQDGKLEKIKWGGRTLIPADSLSSLLNSLRAA